MLIKKNTILVLGATGMLGSAIFDYFNTQGVYIVYGTTTNKKNIKKIDLFENIENNILEIDINNINNLANILDFIKPDLIINCIGVIKQLDPSLANDQIDTTIQQININALFPWRLAKLKRKDTRLIHISTDCVFSGKQGNYTESDLCDCTDIYGKTKLMGEPIGDNVCVIRTSIIGHELNSNISLLDWYLSSEQQVSGYDKAIFSGLPTITLARMLDKYIINKQEICGLYHMSADPIDKFTLLDKVRQVYGKDIALFKDSKLIIDRSLNSYKLKSECGFMVPDWDQMLNDLYTWGRQRGLHTY
jgi:dTDP-4-dehydrorhamnose reductase